MPKINITIYGIELALLPSALTVYLHVPFGLTAPKSPTVEEYERLDRVNSKLTNAVVKTFAAVDTSAGNLPRSEIISRRKAAELSFALTRFDLLLICRALRDVAIEYSNEPKGINVFFGGDEYGASIADLFALRDRLCKIARAHVD